LPVFPLPVIFGPMTEVTRILSAIDQGDPAAAAKLLPLVYEELRKLAAHRLTQEKPGQTLEATALVHEAYLRLVAGDAASLGRKSGEPTFDNRGHFFAAASEAMRRILVDRARARRAEKRGGERQRVPIELDELPSRLADDEILGVDSVLDRLAAEDEECAQIVRLHVFGGLSIEEAGATLGQSRATAYRNWAYARAWLREELPKDS
jgi:RNA polymerase sigma factor (TIGR02999 family)